MEWLILLGFIGLAVGGGLGFALASRGSAGKKRLESELHTARDELQQYRQAVVQEFSDTARKFQTLNDAYRDLHEQLARSSSTLCGDITGPLLEAPAGHQDVIPAQVRDEVLNRAATASATARDRAPGAAATQSGDPYADDEIRVPEPPEAAAAAAAPADAGAASGTPANGTTAPDEAPPAGPQSAATPAADSAPAATPTPDTAEPQRRDVAAG